MVAASEVLVSPPVTEENNTYGGGGGGGQHYLPRSGGAVSIIDRSYGGGEGPFTS